jgi:hypothetical protein
MRISCSRLRLTEKLFYQEKLCFPGDAKYRSTVSKLKAMESYSDHRNIATRREDLDTTAGEGEWCLYALVALPVERNLSD